MGDAKSPIVLPYGGVFSTMKEILYETKLEDYYKELDIDAKSLRTQRMMYAFVFAILGVLISATIVYMAGMQFLILGIVLVPILGFIGWKWLYLQLIRMSAYNKQQLDLLFPEFLTTFISLLNSQANGNVVNAIENTIPYVKEPIKSQLIMLIRRIKEDPSLDSAYFAFNEFARSIDNKESEQILSLLLDMYISGISKETLEDLEERIKRMKQNQITIYANWKNGRLRNKAGLPSLGLGILFIFIWIGVVAYHYFTTAMAGTGL